MQERVKLIGIDLAKNIFWVRAENAAGRALRDQKVSRDKLFEFVVKLGPEKIAMEACSGAHYWARRFEAQGIEVALIPPQYARRYRVSDKNDRNDTHAICEASRRDDVKPVAVKQEQHQDWALLVNDRAAYVARRTEVLNRLRSAFLEYGFCVAKGREKLIKALNYMLGEEKELTSALRAKALRDLEQVRSLDEAIKKLDSEIRVITKADLVCSALAKIRGIGPVTALALRSHVPKPSNYKNGRCFAASLGLVPKQVGTGGRVRLLGMGKDGNRYGRNLLIHGARSVLRTAHRHEDSVSLWAIKKKSEIGFNKACVAVANKNARMVWAVMAKTDHLNQAA